jgi:UDP-N-acetyl-2-amino-2-deoxyglucuronate dehydrogenase
MYRFAVIGCGRIAERHAQEICKYGKIVACCDIEENKLSQFAKKNNAIPFLDADVLFNVNEHQIDIAVICTPNGLHKQHTVMALNAGCNVICEKPMAIRSEDCTEMITAANKNGKKLYVVKQNRYNPPVQELKKILSQKLLGNISGVQLNCFWNRDVTYYNSSWRGTRSLDGGILYTQFSHFIDLLYWFFGDVDTIHGLASNHFHKGVIEFEDTVVANLRFKSGVVGSIYLTINAFQQNMEGSITVFGEKGTIKIGGQYLNEIKYAVIRDYQVPILNKYKEPNQYGTYTGSMSNHDAEYEQIIRHMQNLPSSVTSAEEAYKTVELIERIYKTIQLQSA